MDRYDSNVRVMLLFLSSGSFKVEFMTETAIWCACSFVGWYVYDGKVQWYLKEKKNVDVFEIDRIRGVINGYDELKQMQIG